VIDPNRHPLVEYKTFTQPMFVTEMFMVIHNPTMQLKDFLKTFAPE
jgi:hypothetical protein